MQLKRGRRFVLDAAVYNKTRDIFFVKEIIKKISFSNASQHTHISSVQAVKPSLLFNFLQR